MQNAYALEGDLLLCHPGLITKYQYESNYLAVPAERTNDWCFRVENDIVKEVMMPGTTCLPAVGTMGTTIAMIIGASRPGNLVHIVINNGAHETVGGMPTVADRVNMVKIAEGCGYESAVSVDSFDALDAALKAAKKRGELSFIEVKWRYRRPLRSGPSHHHRTGE